MTARPSLTDTQAQAALRARQGEGARYDSEWAPHDDLLLARRGTAFFSRQLQMLEDHELDEISADAGISRRRVVAEVCYQGRFLAWSLEEMEKAASIMQTESFLEDVERAVTLPTRALRSLFHHSEVHLNVMLRDLRNDDWSLSLPTFEGRIQTIPAFVKARTDVVWGAAQSVAKRLNPSDIPDGVGNNWQSHIPRSRAKG